MQTPTSCCTNGGTYRAQTDTARLNTYSAEHNILLSLLCLPKIFLSTSIRPLLLRMLLMLGQSWTVYLQDLKSAAWDKRGIIVSVRPDRLSYVINVENQFFTRPRHLLRPISSDTPFPVTLSTPPSSPPKLRRSLRIQSRVNTAVLQTPSSPTVPTSTSAPTWHLSSSATIRTSLTKSVDNNSSKNILPNKGAPLLPPGHQHAGRRRPQYPKQRHK